MLNKFHIRIGLALLMTSAQPTPVSAQALIDDIEADPAPMSAQARRQGPMRALPVQAPTLLSHAANGSGLRARLEAPPSRLRCWQQGVAVVDEALATAPTPPAGLLFSGTGADGQQLMLMPSGAALCLLTRRTTSLAAGLPQ